ncbi:MAG: zinc-finger domain-containing protein [Gammaproteobacteria bacterium]|jgi:uncharacterized Zn-finger protein
MTQSNSPATSYVVVTKHEIPFHCPPKDSETWNMHPKVFLSFSSDGKSKCPYCGANYQLEQ